MTTAEFARSISNGIRMVRSPAAFFQGLRAREGAVFSFDLPTEAWTVLTGADALAYFFDLKADAVDPFTYRLRMPTLHLPDIDPPAALVESTALTKSLLRKHLGPELPRMVDLFRGELLSFLSDRAPLAEGRIDDFYRFVLEACVMSVVRVMLGADVHARLPGDFTRRYADVEGAISMRNLIAPWAPSLGSSVIREAQLRLADSFRVLVLNRRGALTSSRPDDLLQSYIEARRPDGTPFNFSDSNIVWMLNSIQWAAHRYPAVHACWLGVTLMTRPDLLRRLLEEQRGIPEVTSATVEKMPYLQGYIKESLRLHALFMIPRITKRDLSFRGHRIPAGRVLAISPHLEHHDPAQYPRPNEILPERWIGDGGGLRAPHAALVPGGGGEWGCIGMRFTTLLLTTFWATLLRNYEITLDGAAPRQRASLMLMPPDRPVAVKHRRRSDAPDLVGASKRPGPTSSVYDIIFESQHREFDFEVTQIEGRIPPDLRGTLLRNGPGIFESGRDPLHGVDGHGMIAAIGFRDGRALFRSRFVQTPDYVAEMALGRQLRRRVLTNKPRWWSNLGDPRIGNPASHDVYYWGGRLLATEAAGHYSLDPISLATIGPYRWGGIAPAGALMSPMPRYDPRTDRLVCYTQRPRVFGQDEVTFHELDRSFVEQSRASCTLSRQGTFIHDVGVTESFYIVIEAPLTFDVAAIVAGRSTVVESTRWDLEATPILTLVPRAGSSRRLLAVPLPKGVLMGVHIVNAYEQGETLIVDATATCGVFEGTSGMPLAMRRMAMRGKRELEISPPAEARMIRYVIDLHRGSVEQAPLGDTAAEHPSTHPLYHGRPYRYAYLWTPGFDGREPVPFMGLWNHEISRLDVETGRRQAWNAGPHCFVSQPVFAPRPLGTAEDDGYVLTWVLDGDRRETDVVILDAAAIEAGPLARLRLGHHLPMMFHGRFFPDLEFSFRTPTSFAASAARVAPLSP